MPSVSQRSAKASSASSSETFAYVTRPRRRGAGVLGADRGIVEAGRYRVRRQRLAGLVLEQHRPRAVEHADRAAREARGVLARPAAAAARLHAVERDPRWRGTPRRDRSRSSLRPRRRRPRRGSRPASRRNCGSRLPADHGLELPDHRRVRVRPERGAQHVVGGRDVLGPVAHRLVDRVLERLRSRVDADDLGAEQPHPRRRWAPAAPCRSRPCRPGTAIPILAAAAAVATPCWPAPVSATTRDLRIRRASRTWPRALLSLCAPVWRRSSRFRAIRAPPHALGQPRRRR